MKKYILFLSVFVFLFFTGCSSDQAFRNYTLNLFQQEISSNTLNLHYSLKNPEQYGISDYPITLGSFQTNETAVLAGVENLNYSLQKFSPKTLSVENQITYDILSYYFALIEKGIPYTLYEEPLSPVTGIHAQLPILLAEYQFHNSEDVQTYLNLLQTLPEYFSSLCEFERQKSAAGLFMSDSAIDLVMNQCHTFLSMGKDNYLLTTFEERVKTFPHSTSLISLNEQIVSEYVLPSYEILLETLASLKGTGKNTGGVCHFPKGKEYYSYLVASRTGSSRTVPELKTLIYKQLSEDILASQQLIPSKSTVSLPSSPDTLLNILHSKLSAEFPEAIPVSVNIKYVPSVLEPYLSPAFYLIPAIDAFTENTIYINRSYTLDTLHLFTTLAHEGYPGHLYQTTYYAATNPDPVRSLFHFQGYVEGWATYAEMCSYYFSSLPKTQSAFLQRNNSIILGLYAAADIGIHYESWSLEETTSFFRKYGMEDAEIIKEIYDLIVGDPANYLAYYIGYVEILELKKECPELTSKEFHERLLKIGPAPFDVVRKYISGEN